MIGISPQPRHHHRRRHHRHQRHHRLLLPTPLSTPQPSYCPKGGLIGIYRRLGGVSECDPNREIGFGSVAFARGRAAIAPRAARGEARRSCARDPGLVRPHPLSKWSPPPVPGAPPHCLAGCLGCAVLPAPATQSQASNFDFGGLSRSRLPIKI